jgi:arginyl-tRNA synthetase
MADPLVVLEQRFAAALDRLGPEASGADPVIRPSQRADYQANVAMALAKRLKRQPGELAEDLVAAVELDDVCESVEIAGPGFINLSLRDDFLVASLADLRSPTRGVRPASEPETVVVDYSAPNVAKEMHVGHLRSTIIGDSLVRILQFVGHSVVRHNHIGDWGTPFGMLIEHLLDLGEEKAVHELTVSDLNSFYQAARAEFDGDPDFAERSRQRVVELQAGDAETMRLWQLLVDHSKRYFTTIYDDLGVTLSSDDFKGESSYNDALVSVVDDLDAKGILVVDDGARCVFPPGFTNRDGDPLPMIVQKRDGGFGYAATDLAALRHRVADLGATRVLYVVGAPQADHLAMVFAVATMAGWLEPPARAEHVSFGSVLGSDGKMFRTRAGETIRLADLVREASERARAVVEAKNPELTSDEMDAVAGAVGIGAVKYADLSTDRVQDYVFDWDRMLALNGNTAPYLQYAHARVRSIFRRAGLDDPSDADELHVVISDPSERALVVKLLAFDGVVQGVVDSLLPHRLCTFLFELASTFTTFYEQCPVLKADTDALRASRLDLCDLTASVLATGLDLLGIEAPDRI